MAMNPPQKPPSWDHSAEVITRLVKESTEKNRATRDKIGRLDAKYCNFETVFLALADAEAELQASVEPLSFYKNVSPNKELRDASSEVESVARDFGIESSMRLDVYEAKVAAEKNIKASGKWEKLSSEEKRLVDKMILDGSRAGLALPQKERDELIRLKKELSQTCLEFDKNFNEENGVITFTGEELKGVPADVVSGYRKRTEDDKEVFDVTYRIPDIGPILQLAENPGTRQRAYVGFNSRLAVNVPVLDKVLDLRRQIAKILGYETWADYVTEVKMAKNAKTVHNFLDDLEDKLHTAGVKQMEILLAMKKKECEEKGLPFDGNYYAWDNSYYDYKYAKEILDIDGNVVKEYFPVSVVVPAVLDIYQNLLSVRFEEIHDASVWHPEVQLFAVWEKDAKDESGFLGYCYLDLFPRAGKYSHAAVWPTLNGRELPTGQRAYPVMTMVANLAKPTPDKPALMRHYEVVTFFHEMGHVFHGLLSKTKFARFHGFNVVLDFGEAPSQMLENWCWEPKVLEQMSSHHETKKPLSPELIEKLVKSRYANVALFNLRQIFLAKFDMKVHTDQESEDYTKLWNSLREKITLSKSGEHCPGQGAFSHLIGYDAGYYGYTYSLVFAADMYVTVFKADPLDPARGKRYRDAILLVGASRDELDSLKDFLGRPPNNEAFIKELFGTVLASHLTA